MDGSNYPNINAFYTKTGSSILLLVFCLCKYNNSVTRFLNRAYRYHVLNKLLILVLYRYEIGIFFSLVICLCFLANGFYYDIVQYCTVSKYKLSTFRGLWKIDIINKNYYRNKRPTCIYVCRSYSNTCWTLLIKKKSRTIRNKHLLMSQLVL